MRRHLRVGLAALLFVLPGCSVSGGKAFLGTVARGPVAGVQSLDRRVVGEACSSPLQTDDYRRAALAAIAQVPGANALTDVTMESSEQVSGGFCLRVSGIAGVLQ
jgi:surface antigen